MELFDEARKKLIEKEQPLAARMRPQALDEFVGQEHILAPGRLLRRAIQADQLSSLIFYGPPGTGKTTLAAVIANTTKSYFEQLNAVLTGIPDLRRVTKEAQDRRGLHGQRTILFVDEVHRWNKAQQDALLPWVENGTVILIGATTENPYFTVNRALVSRSRIFQLTPLNEQDLVKVAQHAVTDCERGYGKLKVDFQEQALEHIIHVANGDARALLNALELAVETTKPKADGKITIDLSVAEDSIQQRAVLYDKEGDYHFDTISAFIKSLRGSDPDAAVYWLAKMVYAGEDPRFLMRRMVIFAAEDIGLADPHALEVAQTAADAFDRVGMPEGRYHLGMAALYLANAPKSNSVFAFFDALAAVEKEKDSDVPTHLKDANRDKEGFGHGRGYLYPHAYRDHWVEQQYLPSTLQGRIFYRPGNLGYEKQIRMQVEQRREAQLAAIIDSDNQSAPTEIFSSSPQSRQFDHWVERTMGDPGNLLQHIRKDVFEQAHCQRHHLVLVANADNGLLLWEALRQTPEGGVYAQVSSEKAQETLSAHLQNCPDLRAPEILNVPLANLSASLHGESPKERVLFDRTIGMNVLTQVKDKTKTLARLKESLREKGLLILAEVIPRKTQRLYDLLPPKALNPDRLKKLKLAEESIYEDRKDPMVNWDETSLSQALQDAGYPQNEVNLFEIQSPQFISVNHMQRWFNDKMAKDASGYANSLRRYLSDQDINVVRQAYTTHLQNQTVQWHTAYALAVGRT
ncbi:MAG: AAA family ATPase [Lentisphaeria bacterium]